MKKGIITFDFDGVMEFEDVQDYFVELRERGYNCFILTSRYDDLTQAFMKLEYEKMIDNQIVWQVCFDKGIPFNRVIFTNMTFKGTFLKRNDQIDPSKLIFHLDDSKGEILELLKHKFNCVDKYWGNWKQECEKAIKEYEK